MKTKNLRRKLIGKKPINFICIVGIALLCLSCKLTDSKNNPAAPTNFKNVRYVVNMISSSTFANPIISYTNANGGTSQLQGMNLDASVQVEVGLSATLSASCTGSYNPANLNASAAINLKLYVNDSLKAEANDFQTDPLSSVTASATRSYKIK
ncbi:MAG: hypothetical protein NTX65_00100 [Ignavibacteriales bacterium]|nr:hypothetical protein [Ignavibacteriales bacterium]